MPIPIYTTVFSKILLHLAAMHNTTRYYTNLCSWSIGPSARGSGLDVEDNGCSTMCVCERKKRERERERGGGGGGGEEGSEKDIHKNGENIAEAQIERNFQDDRTDSRKVFFILQQSDRDVRSGHQLAPPTAAEDTHRQFTTDTHTAT